jgi:hypothetical protein
MPSLYRYFLKNYALGFESRALKRFCVNFLIKIYYKIIKYFDLLASYGNLDNKNYTISSLIIYKNKL